MKNRPSRTLAAGRDDLLVQSLAVAADDYEPGVGDHGDVLSAESGTTRAVTRFSRFSPSIDQISARSSRRLI